MIEHAIYDERDDKIIVKSTYENAKVLESNLVERNAAPDFGRYKGNLVKVASIEEGDVLRLKNLGYDLMANDPAEMRRALCYIQANEPHLLTVPGQPFAMHRNAWA